MHKNFHQPTPNRDILFFVHKNLLSDSLVTTQSTIEINSFFLLYKKMIQISFNCFIFDFFYQIPNLIFHERTGIPSFDFDKILSVDIDDTCRDAMLHFLLPNLIRHHYYYYYCYPFDFYCYYY